MLVKALKRLEAISGGVKGGDMRRSVLLRDYHIGSMGIKGMKEDWERLCRGE